jgi:Sulfotransferase domain/SGNH hydrolase-like domain, acetyltransferase AlgX
LSISPSSKVFIVGDSRTGTYTLHNYFKKHGFAAIHHFTKEAGTTEPLHEDFETNWSKVLDFILVSKYTVFSDYPTRMFWHELAERFPDAYFILSTRQDSSIWLKSMQSFFGSLFRYRLNEEELLTSYTTINERIRTYFAGSGLKFLEICIDHQAEVNAAKLARFLDLPDTVKLGHDNKSADYHNGIFSGRRRFFGDEVDSIEELKSLCGKSRTLPSEYGWLFLINDSNDFLNIQFGGRVWTESECDAALNVIEMRHQILDQRGIRYLKYIIPEKSVVYREYLPKSLQKLNSDVPRPAVLMSKNAKKANIRYLDRYLIDAKSYGQLYFRGDTHPTWLGGYLIYRYIVEELNKSGALDLPVSFAKLIPSVAQYQGDLYTLMDPEFTAIWKDVWGFLSGSHGFDTLLQLQLMDTDRRAVKVDVPSVYKDWFKSRETLVFEHVRRDLPRAVIFRDSTSDFVYDLLAQHFSRSVFIWYQGNIVEEVIEKEHPDFVIHVMAERFVTRYPNFPLFAPLSGLIEEGDEEFV